MEEALNALLQALQAYQPQRIILFGSTAPSAAAASPSTALAGHTRHTGGGQRPTSTRCRWPHGAPSWPSVGPRDTSLRPAGHPGQTPRGEQGRLRRQRPQVVLERIGPPDNRPPVGHAMLQAVDVLEVGGRLPHAFRLRVLGGHSVRGIRERCLQQALPGLRHQRQRGRHRHVGQDMGGVLQPQPSADQALLARLGDKLVQEGPMPLHPHARPQWRQHAGPGTRLSSARSGKDRKATLTWAAAMTSRSERLS